MKETKSLKQFYILWSTQGLSQLGSSMTAFALTLWLYQKTGLALNTAALAICSYLPYVAVSIFAGALTDRFNKKRAMLVCDLLAAASTVIVLVLYKTGLLRAGHLYAINVFSGLMNTVQQPASEVTMTLVVPKEHYQRASALGNLSRSVVSVLNPLLATAIFSLAGLELIIAFDLTTFVIAFVSLLLFIEVPDVIGEKKENVLTLAKQGIGYLRETPLILTIILFMSGVNLVASAFDAVLPAYVIPNARGGESMLGIVTSCAGAAMILGSIVATRMPKPRDRVKVVYYTMFFSLTVANVVFAFSRSPAMWCFAQFLGWFVVPIMSTNLEVIIRTTVPAALQGRIYAARNTLQYFTIPIGLFMGGILVDDVCEPFMARFREESLMCRLFGSGKGSGAALMMLLLGILGGLICFINGRKLKKYSYTEEPETPEEAA